jgi:hypothetical protein
MYCNQDFCTVRDLPFESDWMLLSKPFRFHRRTIIVNNQDAGALDEASCAHRDESPLAQGWLLHNMQPAAR